MAPTPRRGATKAMPQARLVMTDQADLPVLYKLPDGLTEDLEDLQAKIAQFKAGGIDAFQLRAFRVPQGVYEQRESGLFMLRIRIPAGAVLPHQMRTLAKVAGQYGDGVLRVTTRQDIQVHNVPLDNICPALSVVQHEAGLSAKGGGGNTVRNITACYDAGVCAEEAFDVTPYAVALTEFLLPDPRSHELPRKYKIAFSGCERACVGSLVNDVGFIAKRRNGTAGFAVYAGGGMGAYSRLADLLEAFVPASEFHLVAEAVKRVFDAHGERKNKHKARLRFLIKRIGFEAFRGLYQKELAALRMAPPVRPVLRKIACAKPPENKGPRPDNPPGGFQAWRERSVLPQKQSGFYLVQIPLFLGDISAETMLALADVVENHGDGMLRATHRQSVVIRWVPEAALVALYEELAGIGLADAPAAGNLNIVTCAGAWTCREGYCWSRGLGSAIAQELERQKPDLDGLAPLEINVSGCPNACGRHPVGDVGLYGGVRRVGCRRVPYYTVQLGGRVAEGNARLARGKIALPARIVPTFLVELLKAFRDSDPYPDFHAFLDADGRRVADDLAAGYRHVPEFEEDESYYHDWGRQEVFSLEGRGPGECSVDRFELTEANLASAREAIDQQRYHAATVFAARSLLVTRGELPTDDSEALVLFGRHLTEELQVPPAINRVISMAIKCASAGDPEQAFEASPEEVADLVLSVQVLYDKMDTSFRSPKHRTAGRPASLARPGDLSLDACDLGTVQE